MNIIVCVVQVGIGIMFERESKREENLEKRAQALARLARNASTRDGDEGAGAPEKDDGMEDVLRKVDTEFMNLIKQAEEEESKDDVTTSVAKSGAGAE
jgi:dynein intermediate chain 2